MSVPMSPEGHWGEALAVVVAPGPRPDPELDRERLARHREFYLKSAHTVVATGCRLRYRSALGQLSYRAQLGLLFEDTPRHTRADRILDHLRSISLVAELVSVDLLRVGWEGTMWHVRYGEGASFDDSCVVADELRDPADLVGTAIELEDAWGTAPVDWPAVAEFCEHVNDWMALRPDMLILAGSVHGPILTIEHSDAVLRFPPDEPRLVAGDSLRVGSPQLGEVTATVAFDTTGEE